MGSPPNNTGVPSIELTLYISGSAMASQKAVNNLQKLLRAYKADQVRLTICDLSVEFSATAEADKIAFAPTLVKRSPEPKAWILGSLDDSSPVIHLLEDARIEKNDE